MQKKHEYSLLSQLEDVVSKSAGLLLTMNELLGKLGLQSVDRHSKIMADGLGYLAVDVATDLEDTFKQVFATFHPSRSNGS